MKKRVLYITLFLLLLSTLIVINLLESTYLIPLTTFIFIFLPGYLLIDLLNLKVNKTKTFVFSLGISVVFLMVGGLVLDQGLYELGISRPLDSFLFPLILLLGIGALLTLAYSRDCQGKKKLDWKIKFNTHEIFLLALSISLLIFVIYSSLYVRRFNYNSFSILAYFLTILVFLAILKTDKVSEKKYPLFLIILGVSLVLPSILRYNYIVGWDIFREYQVYRHIDVRGNWSIITDRTNLMASLSINFFPVVVTRLTGISGMTIFRYLIPLIFSCSILSIYEISKKFLSNNMAFITGIFYSATPYYFRSITSPRTVLSIFFVSLIVLLVVSKIHSHKFQILFFLFSVGIVVSHYATAFIFLFSLIALSFGRLILEKLDREYSNYLENLKNVHLLIYFFILYILLNIVMGAVGTFERVVDILYSSLPRFSDFVNGEEIDGESQAVAGRTLGQAGISQYLQFAITWIIMLLMMICAFYILKRLLMDEGEYKERELLCLIIAGGIILLAFIAVPGISNYYNLQRVYISAIVFMAPSFVLGVSFLVKKKKAVKYVVLAIVILFLFSNVGVTFQLAGYQRGYALRTEGDDYLEHYVSRAEFRSASWLDEYREEEVDIYTTELGETRRLDIAFEPPDDQFLYPQDIVSRLDNETMNEGFEGYVYLYRANVEYNKRRVDDLEVIGYVEFQQQDELINNSDVIYSNGDSTILKSSSINN